MWWRFENTAQRLKKFWRHGWLSVVFKTLTLSHIPVLVDHPTPGDIAMAESLIKDYAIES